MIFKNDSLIERDGIYFAKDHQKISYPPHGNENCFSIEDDSFWFNHRNRCIIETVRRYSNDVTFFDVGGGNGFVSKGLEENGIQAVLVEPGIDGCLNAKRRGLKNIICATLETAYFKKDSLAAIGLFDVVEHIEDDVSFLRTVQSCLGSGGYVFITVPAYRMLWSDIDINSGHFRRYTIKSLANKLESVGFEVMYKSYFFSILPLAIYALRVLPYKLGLNRKANNESLQNYNSVKRKPITTHKSKKGFLNRILNLIWVWELNWVKKGRRILFGGSCLLVAKKE